MVSRFASMVIAVLALCLSFPAMADEYKTRFVSLAPGVPGLLHEPTDPRGKAGIGVLVMHTNADYLRPFPANPCEQLAQRGYRVLCANTSASKSGFWNDGDIDKLLLNVKAGVVYLRADSAVHKVVLFGHSGGGAMMAAYQNIAENGLKACQGPEKLIKCSSALADMPAADGLMLIDSVLGGPVTTLWSLDPAVIDETDAQQLAPELDMFNPANGFKPGGSMYSGAFKERFFAQQGERMNRLIATAQQRLAVIEAGKGRFKDDEPMVIAGANGAHNKLNTQDLTLQARTVNAWPLLHANGSVTKEVIHSVRVPRVIQTTTSLAGGGLTTTVRKFLNTWAIRTTKDYGYDATSIRGIDFTSSYANAIDSIAGINRPLLQVAMTGSHEFFASEFIRQYAKSTDKTLAYVEGAKHDFMPCTECAVAKGLPANQYGDTLKTLFDYIDTWLSTPERFIARNSP